MSLYEEIFTIFVKLSVLGKNKFKTMRKFFEALSYFVFGLSCFLCKF